MKFKFSIAAILVLTSTMYCHAGFLDKLDKAINTATAVNAIVKTNTPNQDTVSKQPEQNTQANTTKPPQPSDLVATPQKKDSEPTSAPLADVPKVKAFKTLNFGDSVEVTKQKLAEIVGNDQIQTGRPFAIGAVWRELFDTDAEWDSYFGAIQSDKRESLAKYFDNRVGGVVFSCDNSTISVNCYQLGMGLDTTTPQERGGLAIVEVEYRNFELAKLLEGFMQNYPNAKKGAKHYKFQSSIHPGVYFEFDRTIYSETSADKRATLSIPTEKFAITFTEIDKLSQEQLAVWKTLMAQDQKTQLKEYFESVKTSLLELAKNMASQQATRNRLDALTYQGWYDNHSYESIIYDGPIAKFVSKQLLGIQHKSDMDNYEQTVGAQERAEKAKQKKELESSSSF